MKRKRPVQPVGKTTARPRLTGAAALQYVLEGGDPVQISLIPGESIIVAGLNFLTAATNLVRVMIEGQTPEQRKEFWDRHLKDTAKVRALLHLDD